MFHALIRPVGAGLAICSALLLWSGRQSPTAADMRSLPAANIVTASGHRAASMGSERPAQTQEVSVQAAQLTELEQVFDLSDLGPEQTAWAANTIGGSCDFDWSRLLPALKGRRIKIQIATPPARGMFYPAELRLEVHKYYYRTNKTQASRILAWELAHAADIFSMTDAQRQQVIALYDMGSSDTHQWLTGPYEEQVGEAFMEGFVSAYCQSLAVRSNYFTHVTTPEIGRSIRELLG